MVASNDNSTDKICTEAGSQFYSFEILYPNTHPSKSHKAPVNVPGMHITARPPYFL